MKKFPRAAILDGKRTIVIVLEDALDEIFGVAHIIPAGRVAFQAIYVECHGVLVRNWWAWVDLNYRPHPYQGCALAT